MDLAGSERSSKTFAKGTRIKEAGSINRSLHTLGRCIEAMRHNQRVTKSVLYVVILTKQVPSA